MNQTTDKVTHFMKGNYSSDKGMCTDNTMIHGSVNNFKLGKQFTPCANPERVFLSSICDTS